MKSLSNTRRTARLLVLVSTLFGSFAAIAQEPPSADETVPPPVLASAPAEKPAKLQLDTHIAKPAAKAKPKVSPKPKWSKSRGKEASAAAKPTETPTKKPVELSLKATQGTAGQLTEAESFAPASVSEVPPLAVATPELVEPSAASIGQVLERVFATHPQVQQALGEVEATRFAIEGARAGYYPYAQVQSAIANRSEEGNTTISIVQPLWDGGLTSAQLEEAKQRREAAFASLTQIRINLSQEVITAVFDILGAEAQLELWDLYISHLQKSRTTIENRAQNGVAPEADVQTVLVRISLAESGRETARTQRITARSRLSSLMSEPPPPLKWPDDVSRLKAEDLAALLDRVEYHPSMIADRQAIEIQKAVADGSKASLWPQLSLQHRQQLSGDKFDPSNDSTLFVLQYQTTNGVRAYQRGRSEEAKVGSAEQKLVATRAALQAQFRSDTAQLLAFATQIGSQGRAATAATNLVDSYQRQFEAGRKTWLELLNAIREAHDSRLQAANTERAYWQANLRLVLQATLWDRLGLEGYLDPLAAADAEARKSDTKFWDRLGFDRLGLNSGNDAPKPSGIVEGNKP